MSQYHPVLIDLIAESGRVLDGGGVYGHFLHYGMVFFFGSSAALIFFYFWRKGELDMNEDPKYQMLSIDENGIDLETVEEGDDG
jgi:hypothetical protein